MNNLSKRISCSTLTKLRLSRNDLTATEKEKFKQLLESDDFYKIRLPSDVLNPTEKEYVISSGKARCLSKDGLDEHIIINMVPAALKKLLLDRHLSTSNVRKVVSEADGYQPHLIAPEQGYERLVDGSLGYFKGPTEASVDLVHFILKELVSKSMAETAVSETVFCSYTTN
ncbi:hypothetical protein L2E82_49864 [Cichorium intybus]|uniref:Uncharacterized protein n=1 Tax=Cichorium intybus TaxID=13427 RepID=A0ACB8Z127_CICIN|nr:hypothetical protein L2E82_49864 [Cichorium intybus]